MSQETNESCRRRRCRRHRRRRRVSREYFPARAPDQTEKAAEDWLLVGVVVRLKIFIFLQTAKVVSPRVCDFYTKHDVGVSLGFGFVRKKTDHDRRQKSFDKNRKR